MKQGLKYGFFFTLAFPLGCAFAAEQLKDDMSSTLHALNAITSKVDEAPALLLLTPSQLDDISSPAERNIRQPAKRLSSKKAGEPTAVPASELKALQAKIERLNTTLAQQEQELKQLRQTAKQDADARAEVAQLKQNLQENLLATEQMQQDMKLATAVKSENAKDNSRLQQALDKSQQQSSALQKQLDVLAKSHNDNNQENKALQIALNESRKQAEEAKKALVALTMKANEKELKASLLQKQLDLLIATQAVKSSERDTLKAQAAQSNQQNEAVQKQLATLTNQVKEKAQQMAVLQKQVEALTVSNSEKAQGNQTIQAALDESQKQREVLQDQLAALKVRADAQQQENSALQQRLVTLQKADIEPKSVNEIRDYSIGSSLAEDMLALLKERATQGIEVDSRIALAGVQDTFAGQLKLLPDQIKKALDATEVALNSNEKQQKLNIETAGARYIEQFKKQKQVKKEPSGYFYRIDNTGSGPIGPNSIVTVVVKESLTNGKVIKDMDAAGTSITQPLSSYPPMFKSALMQLQNHGSMTMVVPPNLAYGDKGLPPDIPPGSTMIYNVKILDVMVPADTVTPVK